MTVDTPETHPEVPRDRNDKEDESLFPFMSHLVELRTRLIWCLAVLGVAFGISYYFAPQIFDFLVAPLQSVMLEKGSNPRLIATGLTETFFTYLKVAFWTACFVSFPLIAAQIWAFVAPGLYKHEKRAFLPFLVATPVLFLAGAAMVYYLIFPMAWRFFLSFEITNQADMMSIEVEARVSEYLSLVMLLLFAFGASFQLPVLLTLLARVGVVTSKDLAKFRKYAVLVIFVLAAVLTPPDPISQLSLALPLLLLYEGSIWMAKLMERNRTEMSDKAEDEGEGDEKQTEVERHSAPEDFQPPAP